MGFDLFDLLLTSGACGTSGACPAFYRPPLSERVYSSWGIFLSGWAGPPCMRDFFYFVIWVIPIHTIMSHPPGMVYSSGGKCKGCCLGGLYYIRNTLHMFTTPQQQYGTSLLYEQGNTAKVLGK